ncbi:MAG: hypothetical protein OJF49_002646 [Ktedonobacterales bacterium]|jgi:hypothetical protein|nr:MAG: hypothetical protein OJF49_002646 [Ktedonobacterales bacterium]
MGMGVARGPESRRWGQHMDRESSLFIMGS